MRFENKCFNCPVRRVMEKDFHDSIKDQYRENNGATISFSCGGAFNTKAYFTGKDGEFYQLFYPCALDVWLVQHNLVTIKK